MPHWKENGPSVAKQDAIEPEGAVTSVLPDQKFRVRLDNGHEVLATVAGKVRKNRIRVLEGDWVELAVSPYDLTRSRITYRHQANTPSKRGTK